MAQGRAFIGTSGFYYKDWHAAFYPASLRKPDLLPYYAQHFSTVEINASFYRLLTAKAVADWNSKTPSNFVFAIKGSRFITHMKKLKEVGPGLERFFGSITGFGRKLGPILWQLPAVLRKDTARLDAFLRQLPKRKRHAVEFRHPSWFDDEVFAVLKKHRAALVWLSTLHLPMLFEVTAGFVYLRFHGLEGGMAHDYTAGELEPWAENIRKELNRGRDTFAFFNNDQNARAPENAKLLMRMVTG